MKYSDETHEAYRRIFDVIRPRTVTSGWMLWAVIVLGLLLILMLWRAAVRMRRREERYVLRIFHRLAEERGLTEAEEALLLQMAREQHLENLLMIFGSTAAFERGVDRILSTDAGAGSSREEALVPALKSVRQKLHFHHLPHLLRHSRQIAIGSRLMVGFKREEQARFCSCIVVDNDPLRLTLAPLLKADEAALQAVGPEEILYVRFWQREDGEYQFRSRLLPGSDPRRDRMFLAHSDALARVQRRDFFRIPIHLPVVLYSLSGEEAPVPLPPDIRLEEGATPWLEGVLINLSGGGGALQADEPVRAGERFVIDPGYRGEFALAGVALRVIRSGKTREGHFLHYLEFLNVTGTFQDRLVQQLYQHQLAMAQA